MRKKNLPARFIKVLGPNARALSRLGGLGDARKDRPKLGLSSITDKQKEAAWRVQFDALGEQLIFENIKQGVMYNGEATRQAALRWLSERDRTAQLAWFAFFATIAGVLISIVGLLVATH